MREPWELLDNDNLDQRVRDILQRTMGEVNKPRERIGRLDFLIDRAHSTLGARDQRSKKYDMGLREGLR
ncbi:hypothetical protein ACH5RR_023627 [Cinchona calisaya]|uniref:Uncharacterized protein n=1 Tax=Cinchona calisaya TaxID=153742 RepID=A0ABD2ZB72_9GENT